MARALRATPEEVSVSGRFPFEESEVARDAGNNRSKSSTHDCLESLHQHHLMTVPIGSLRD
jgi:hypothetical protein